MSIRVTGHHARVGTVFLALWRLPLVGPRLAFWFVWPWHHWLLRYYAAGKRVA